MQKNKRLINSQSFREITRINFNLIKKAPVHDLI